MIQHHQHQHQQRCKGSKAREFTFTDPLDLERLLSSEERMIRDQVREYAQNSLMPRVLEANRLVWCSTLNFVMAALLTTTMMF